jgi:hypothetical protein
MYISPIFYIFFEARKASGKHFGKWKIALVDYRTETVWPDAVRLNGFGMENTSRPCQSFVFLVKCNREVQNLIPRFAKQYSESECSEKSRTVM